MTNKRCVCIIIGPIHTGRSFKGGVGNSGYRLQSQNHSLYQIDPINIFASMDQFDASTEIHPRH